MLLPFEFAILSVEEARVLVAALRKSAPRSRGGHIEIDAATRPVFEHLELFIRMYDHYQGELSDFHQSTFEKRNDY